MNEYTITFSMVESTFFSKEEDLVFSNKNKSSFKRTTNESNQIFGVSRSDKGRSSSLKFPIKPTIVKEAPKFFGQEEEIEHTLIHLMRNGSDFEKSWKVLSDNKMIKD